MRLGLCLPMLSCYASTLLLADDAEHGVSMHLSLQCSAAGDPLRVL